MNSQNPHDTQNRHRQIHSLSIELARIKDMDALLPAIAAKLAVLLPSEHVLLLTPEIEDEQVIGLHYAASSDTAAEDTRRLKNAYIKVFGHADDPVIERWLSGSPITLQAGASGSEAIDDFMATAGFKLAYTVPLQEGDTLLAVVLVQIDAPINDETLDWLHMALESIAVSLNNTRLRAETVAELADKVERMNIMQQIDRELNDTIALDTVFDYTLDWALRFTNATAASIALYDEESDHLRTRFHYGYAVSIQKYDELRSTHMSITHRVARSGEAEIVPDVQMDKDYVPIAGTVVQSQMAVPVMREDRVIAVMTLESNRINGFTEDHMTFVTNLANRAAVAIDNARLYTEAVHEREKLAHILSNIIDAVIVVGVDDRIVLMNQSAQSVLRMYTNKNYTGQPFEHAIDFTPLLEMFARARIHSENLAEEITLPDERVFYTKAGLYTGIGWIIVMQDVTPYKEMDQLKSELIATVSHDLKQPLSVMQGYLELLDMRNEFDTSSRDFVVRIDRSIHNMRSLIDDLLDLARFETGIDLKQETIALKSLLLDCIEETRSSAVNKAMTLTHSIPDNLPAITGEQARMVQIFTNLIGNAVKYTQPEGKVHVEAEQRGQSIRVAIRDNGPGIGAEDQARIFERFYRVRSPDTDGIDGTGLVLAIVKSLVEAHRGTIRLESEPGNGTTFYVTLPVENNQPETAYTTGDSTSETS